MGNHEPQELMTVREVARELRLSKFTVYRHVEQGSLTALRVGEHGPLRIPRAALDELLRPAGPKAAA